MWEPSAYKDAAGDRVNVCLEASEEAVAAVAGWEAAAVKMAATPLIFTTCKTFFVMPWIILNRSMIPLSKACCLGSLQLFPSVRSINTGRSLWVPSSCARGKKPFFAYSLSFRIGNSCSVSQAICDWLAHHGTVGAEIDFANAFDNVPWDVAAAALTYGRVSPHVVSFLRRVWSAPRSCNLHTARHAVSAFHACAWDPAKGPHLALHPRANFASLACHP